MSENTSYTIPMGKIPDKIIYGEEIVIPTYEVPELTIKDLIKKCHTQVRQHEIFKTLDQLSKNRFAGFHWHTGSGFISKSFKVTDYEPDFRSIIDFRSLIDREYKREYDA